MLWIVVLCCVLGGCATLETTGRASNAGIAYFRSGSGTPAVVFQSGLGDGKSVWTEVIRRLRREVLAFAYDRPGYGDSLALSGARDPCAIAREQKALLSELGIEPPYVLVGHSLGGLYAYVYARLYPEDVAGLVLLDPTHPDHFRRMREESPATASALTVASKLFRPAMRREFDDQSHCLDRLAGNAPLGTPVRLLGRSAFELLEKGAFERMTRELAEDWRRLAGAQRVEIVPHAGHYIQKDRPDAVVHAIQRVLAAHAAQRGGDNAGSYRD